MSVSQDDVPLEGSKTLDMPHSSFEYDCNAYAYQPQMDFVDKTKFIQNGAEEFRYHNYCFIPEGYQQTLYSYYGHCYPTEAGNEPKYLNGEYFPPLPNILPPDNQAPQQYGHVGIGVFVTQPHRNRPLGSPRRVNRFRPKNRERLSLRIADSPVATLDAEQKARYAVFKDVLARQSANGQKTPPSDEEKDVCLRVLQSYSAYTGIPEYVQYNLGYYDGTRFCPREKPVHRIRMLFEEDIKAKVRHEAEEFTEYYHSVEWDRTGGWSKDERVTLLDQEALTIAQPTSSETNDGAPITTVYVVLMHQIPSMIPQTKFGDPPIPCLQTKGDLISIIRGEKACKAQFALPPLIPRKWRGDIFMCGFKTDGQGKRVPMIIRGRQDVGKMYQTIHNVCT